MTSDVAVTATSAAIQVRSKSPKSMMASGHGWPCSIERRDDIHICHVGVAHGSTELVALVVDRELRSAHLPLDVLAASRVHDGRSECVDHVVGVPEVPLECAVQAGVVEVCEC